jgi:hypothetical protein
MISMLQRCGEQFRRRYGARFGWADTEEIIPPSVSLVIGINTHKTIEKNLTSKIETGALLPTEEIKDTARDLATKSWDEEILLDPEEVLAKAQVQADSVDTTISLSVLHHEVLAPTLRPKTIERRWVIQLEGFPYDLGGTWDIQEEDGVLRDTKTAAKSPTQNDADRSDQLTLYSMASKICENVAPPYMCVDTLVKLKEPKLITFATTRDQAQNESLLRRIERAAEVIDGGRFMPANPTDWWCNPRFCGYAPTCKFYNGK